MRSTDLFKDNHHKTPKSFYWICGCIVGIIGLCIGYSINFNLEKIKILFSEESIKNWVLVIIGFLSSILSTLFYEIYIRKHNEVSKLNELQKIAPENLTVNVLNTLESFGNKYYSDYFIKCWIRPSDHPNYFNIHVRYKFCKIITVQELQFQFSRIRNEQDRRLLDALGNNKFLDYEFFEIFDETDFHSDSPVVKENYRVNNLTVTINDRIKSLPLTRLDDDNNVIFKSYIENEDFEMNSLVQFEFDVVFPLEKDSFHDFVFDLPTNKIDCELDYSAVESEIFITGTYFISSKNGPTIVRRGEDKSFAYVYNSWVLPKSALVFTWWRRR